VAFLTLHSFFENRKGAENINVIAAPGRFDVGGSEHIDGALAQVVLEAAANGGWSGSGWKWEVLTVE